MKQFADPIRETIDAVVDALAKLNTNQLTTQPEPGKWSKQEIMGHLLDSAANNHQRFVRAAYEDVTSFPSYNQDAWVQVQQYNELPWGSLIKLWEMYNRHICHVIEHLPDEALLIMCDIGRDKLVTLDFAIQDYHRHMRHHLNQIVDLGN